MVFKSAKDPHFPSPHPAPLPPPWGVIKNGGEARLNSWVLFVFPVVCSLLSCVFMCVCDCECVCMRFSPHSVLSQNLTFETRQSSLPRFWLSADWDEKKTIENKKTLLLTSTEYRLVWCEEKSSFQKSVICFFRDDEEDPVSSSSWLIFFYL